MSSHWTKHGTVSKQHRPGQNYTGLRENDTELNKTAQDKTAQDWTKWHRNKLNCTGLWQNYTELDKTAHDFDKTAQNCTKLDKTTQNWTKLNRTWQNGTKLDKTQEKFTSPWPLQHARFPFKCQDKKIRTFCGDFSVGVMVINKDCFSIILYFGPRKNYVESKARCHNAHVTQLFIYHPW